MAFGFGTPHFLGIDFGTGSIKAVELSLKNNQPVLVNYGQVYVNQSVGDDPAVSYEQQTIDYLKTLQQNMKPESVSAYMAMPAFSGLIFFVELPLMEESELKEAVRFEARKYIPSSLDEIALSWKVIGVVDTPDKGKQMEVLLVSALNKEIARYERYAIETGLKIDTLELETFSLTRSIVGNEKGVFLIIDIGSRATNLILVDNGIVKISRNLDTGGRDVTHVIQESLGVTNERAESLKKSGKNFFTSQGTSLSFLSLQSIGNEALRMLESYQVKHPETKCEKVFLSGGTAHFAGIVDYYTELLHLPVVMGNPWQRIQYDSALETQIQELGTSFSVAVGLALAGVDALSAEKENTENPLMTKKKFSFKDIFTKKL
ncbi:MAG: type IV pilus assembly protein PilM [Candidatus Moranbacteria bacterium]|nr:type IV pilus assembly protein PilM [Candidatus Moranbacteria bacterium]